MIDSPPSFTNNLADDVFMPHITYLRKYDRNGTYWNFTVEHRPGASGEVPPDEDDTSLCNWWITVFPGYLSRNSIDDTMARTMAITITSPIVFYTQVNENINTVNDLFRSVIIRRNKPISEGGMGGVGNLTVYAILPNLHNEFRDFLYQAEQRFDDLSWIIFQEQPQINVVMAGLASGTAIAVIGPASIFRAFGTIIKPIAVNGQFPTSILPDTTTFLSQGYSFRGDIRLGFAFSPNAVRVNRKRDVDAMREWGAKVFDGLVRQDLDWNFKVVSDSRIVTVLSATKPKSLRDYFTNGANDLKILAAGKRFLLSGQSVPKKASPARSVLICLLSLLSIWVTSILIETVRSDLRTIKKVDNVAKAKLNKKKGGVAGGAGGGGLTDREYIKRKEELLKTQLPPFFRRHKKLYRALPHLLLAVSCILFIVAALWAHVVADIDGISFPDINKNNNYQGAISNTISFNGTALFVSWIIAFVFCYSGFQLIIRESITESFIAWNRSIDRRTRELLSMDQKVPPTPANKRKMNADESNHSSDHHSSGHSDPALTDSGVIDPDNPNNNNNNNNLEVIPHTLQIIFRWRFLLGGLLIGLGYLLMMEFIYWSVFFPYVDFYRYPSIQAGVAIFTLIIFPLFSSILVVNVRMILRLVLASVFTLCVFGSHKLFMASFDSRYALYYNSLTMSSRQSASNQVPGMTDNTISSETIDLVIISLASLLIVAFLGLNVALLKLSRSALDQGVLGLMRTIRAKQKQIEASDRLIKELEDHLDLKNKLLHIISYCRPIPNAYTDEEINNLLIHPLAHTLIGRNFNRGKGASIINNLTGEAGLVLVAGTNSNKENNKDNNNNNNTSNEYSKGGSTNNNNNNKDNNNPSIGDSKALSGSVGLPPGQSIVFEDLLIHPLTIELVKDWSKEAHVEENVLFLLSIQQFKLLLSGNNNSQFQWGGIVGGNNNNNNNGNDDNIVSRNESSMKNNNTNNNNNNITITKSNAPKLLLSAIKIFHLYIEVDSPLQLNISHSQRLKIINFMTNNNLIHIINQKEKSKLHQYQNMLFGPSMSNNNNNNNNKDGTTLTSPSSSDPSFPSSSSSSDLSSDLLLSSLISSINYNQSIPLIKQINSLYDDAIIEVYRMMQSQLTAFKSSSQYAFIMKIITNSKNNNNNNNSYYNNYKENYDNNTRNNNNYNDNNTSTNTNNKNNNNETSINMPTQTILSTPQSPFRPLVPKLIINSSNNNNNNTPNTNYTSLNNNNSIGKGDHIQLTTLDSNTMNYLLDNPPPIPPIPTIPLPHSLDITIINNDQINDSYRSNDSMDNNNNMIDDQL